MPRPCIDLSGQVFGRFAVMGRAGFYRTKGNFIWMCVCECGNLRVVRTGNLRQGKQKSCGCWRKEFVRENATHGRTNTPEYKSYQHAKARCTNPNDAKFTDYRARGIKFLFASFEEFYAELGEKPEPKRSYSVDRIDNYGHYEVGNVQWATAKQQANNRRKRSCWRKAAAAGAQ